jgi:hypothetical protein
MPFKKLLSNRKNKNKPEQMYLVRPLPGDRTKLQKILSKYTKLGFIPESFQTDYQYVVLRRNNNMEKTEQEQEQKYKVLELPNNCKGIEQLLNNQWNLGFELLCKNDYSATFVLRGE